MIPSKEERSKYLRVKIDEKGIHQVYTPSGERLPKLTFTRVDQDAEMALNDTSYCELTFTAFAILEK
jgi:hypothetical protein